MLVQSTVQTKERRVLLLEFANTIRIDQPKEEVFAFLSDFENIPKWNYFVLKVTKTSEGSVALGTTYHQIRKTDEQDFHITEFEPNYKISVKTLPQSSPRFERQFTILEERNTTVITDKWVLDTGRPSLIEKLAAGKVKTAVAENLGKLKKLLETGSVTLQDGREVIL